MSSPVPNEVKSLAIWRCYQRLKSESEVIRSGFGLYGVYQFDMAKPFDRQRSESDLEHTAGLTWLTALVSMFYPGLIPASQMALSMLVALVHEIGETELGDIPDDGLRDENKKRAIEHEVLQGLISDLPPFFRRRILIGFTELQARTTERGRIMYCLDKLETILQGLIYESEGRGGDYHYKMKQRRISQQDRNNIRDTGSCKLVDIWSKHFLEKIADFPEAPIFTDILRAAVVDIRGEWFSWYEESLSK